eukprot:COSAG02_NODE_1554_length_11948_cov_41.539455_7_plen_763_part_00
MMVISTSSSTPQHAAATGAGVTLLLALMLGRAGAVCTCPMGQATCSVGDLVLDRYWGYFCDFDQVLLCSDVVRPRNWGTSCVPDTLGHLEADIVINYPDELTALNLSALTSVGGYFVINARALTTLDLSALTTVGDNIAVDQTALTALDLSALITVGGGLIITANNALTALDLSALITVGGRLIITANNALTALDVSALTTVGGRLSIEWNNALTALDLSALRRQNGIHVPDSRRRFCSPSGDATTLSEEACVALIAWAGALVALLAAGVVAHCHAGARMEVALPSRSKTWMVAFPFPRLKATQAFPKPQQGAEEHEESVARDSTAETATLAGKAKKSSPNGVAKKSWKKKKRKDKRGLAAHTALEIANDLDTICADFDDSKGLDDDTLVECCLVLWCMPCHFGVTARRAGLGQPAWKITLILLAALSLSFAFFLALFTKVSEVWQPLPLPLQAALDDLYDGKQILSAALAAKVSCGEGFNESFATIEPTEGCKCTNLIQACGPDTFLHAQSSDGWDCPPCQRYVASPNEPSVEARGVSTPAFTEWMDASDMYCEPKYTDSGSTGGPPDYFPRQTSRTQCYRENGDSATWPSYTGMVLRSTHVRSATDCAHACAESEDKHCEYFTWKLNSKVGHMECTLWNEFWAASEEASQCFNTRCGRQASIVTAARNALDPVRSEIKRMNKTGSAEMQAYDSDKRVYAYKMSSMFSILVIFVVRILAVLTYVSYQMHTLKTRHCVAIADLCAKSDGTSSAARAVTNKFL